MPEYLSPGVYVDEFEIGAKPIEGVSTSTAGFLGETERGPTVPRLVTSWLEYQRVFGSYLGSDKYLPYTVQGFFDNGGKRCYVGRIVKAGDAAATAATVKLAAGSANALTVTAIGEGAWGNRVAVKVSPGSLSGFRLSVYYWKSAPTALFDPDYDQKANPRPTAVEFYDNLSVDEAFSRLLRQTGERGFQSGTARQAGRRHGGRPRRQGRAYGYGPVWRRFHHHPGQHRFGHR